MEEGTYICSHEGDILNSKSEWHQAKVIRITTKMEQGGAKVGREQGGRQAEGSKEEQSRVQWSLSPGCGEGG